MPSVEDLFSDVREDYDDVLLSYVLSHRLEELGVLVAARTNLRLTRERFVQQRGFSSDELDRLLGIVAADYESIESKVENITW